MSELPTYRVLADGRVVPSHQWCCHCRRLLRLVDFPWNVNRYHTRCRRCSTLATLRWQAMNPGWQFRLPRMPWVSPRRPRPLQLSPEQAERLYAECTQIARDLDVAHGAYLRIIGGEAPDIPVAEVVRFQRKWQSKMFTRFGLVSLDAPLPATANARRPITLHDVLAASPTAAS